MEPQDDNSLLLPAEIAAQLPAADRLPMPTEEEMRLTEQAAAEVLAYILKQSLPDTTRQALQTALNYWSAWHWAVYGEELGLLCTPAVPVPGDKVLVFISQHAPVIEDKGAVKRIRTGMPEHVRQRMIDLNAIGKRQVARRAGRAALIHGDKLQVDADVPALKTLQQRVSLLGTLHFYRGFERPQDVDGRIRPWMSALGKAARLNAQIVLPQSKQAVEADEFQRLLDACGSDTLAGKRDQALLLAAYSSGRRRSEVARMQQEHLRPGQMVLPDGQTVLGYWWDLYKMKGRTSDRLGEPVHSVPLVGAAAEAMDDWLDVLRRYGHDTGPVWRTVRARRGRRPKIPVTGPEALSLGVGIQPPLVAEIVKQRACQALLAQRPELQGDDQDVVAQRERLLADYADRLGAHSLRSGFSTSQIKAGVSAYDVMKLTGHSSMSSFRIYDQSGNERNPVIAELMRFTL